MVRKEKINNVNLEKKKGFIICTGVVVIFLIVIMIPMDLKAFGLMKRKREYPKVCVNLQTDVR